MTKERKTKIVQINTVSNGSTGTIMMSLHEQLLRDGYDSYVVWGRGRRSQNRCEYYMNDSFGVYFHVLYSRLTGKIGFASKRATCRLLKKLDEIQPDIIHLHNLHGYYINIEMLFDYIAKHNIKTVWTLHDCWAFTGHCVHFNASKCNCWRGEKCINIKSYPKSFMNTSLWCYRKKKLIFGRVGDLTIVTPSEWLMGLVKKSFLKNRNGKVINNGIDTTVFRRLGPSRLSFKKKNGLDGKKIILGVAAKWDNQKGLDDFIDLSLKLDGSYKIVLVGLSKNQIDNLPDGILGLGRTDNVEQLVEIYNSADVFFNPTHEDNYPTVNLEAAACGVPIVTYRTGGSPEILEKGIGFVVRNLNEFLDVLPEISSCNLVPSADLSCEKMYKEYKMLYEKNE